MRNQSDTIMMSGKNVRIAMQLRGLWLLYPKMVF